MLRNKLVTCFKNAMFHMETRFSSFGVSYLSTFQLSQNCFICSNSFSLNHKDVLQF